jgi:hypothetical protein
MTLAGIAARRGRLRQRKKASGNVWENNQGGWLEDWFRLASRSRAPMRFKVCRGSTAAWVWSLGLRRCWSWKREGWGWDKISDLALMLKKEWLRFWSWVDESRDEYTARRWPTMMAGVVW